MHNPYPHSAFPSSCFAFFLVFFIYFLCSCLFILFYYCQRWFEPGQGEVNSAEHQAAADDNGSKALHSGTPPALPDSGQQRAHLPPRLGLSARRDDLHRWLWWGSVQFMVPSEGLSLFKQVSEILPTILRVWKLLNTVEHRMRDNLDKRPPWWKTTLMRDHPDERQPWWKISTLFRPLTPSDINPLQQQKRQKKVLLQFCAKYFPQVMLLHFLDRAVSLLQSYVDWCVGYLYIYYVLKWIILDVLLSALS